MRPIAVILLLCAVVRADAESPRKEASAHFQRGVELYNDGDFRGALVEFKRAYAIWPRANVLYDVGQTQYQLLDYAAALKTMERYLAETGPNAAHRAEVEATVETLRGRVGRIAIVTSVPECEVVVDDQAAGTTPLAQPILVSVGARKVEIRCAGHAPVVRQVEVSADETTRLEPRLPLPATAAPSLKAAGAPLRSPARPVSPRTRMAVTWSVSALLAAGTLALGTATLVEQSRLDGMKATYPVMRDPLDRQAAMVLGLSIATDAVAVAGLVSIAVSTYLTVKIHREQKVRLGLVGPTLAAAF